MGHCINYIIAERDADRDQILSEIREEVSHADWEEGGHYPGNLHLQSHWHDSKIYDSEEDAHDAIERLEIGSYDDHAVLFRDTRKLESAKTRKIEEQIAANKARRSDYIDSHHVTSRKSAYIGCPECGSKLSREHLGRRAFHDADHCPLCGTDLRSETVQGRIAGFDAKAHELEGRLADAKRELVDKAPVKWLVKYEYHI